MLKGQFKPQQVLCNETNTFVSLEAVVPKMSEVKYCRLTDESVPEKEGRTASIDEIAISRFNFPLGKFGELDNATKDKYREIIMPSTRSV